MQLSGGGVTKVECRRLLQDTCDMPCILAVEDAESCFVAESTTGAELEHPTYGSAAPYGARYGGRGKGITVQQLPFGGSPFGGSPIGGKGPLRQEKPVSAKQFVSLLCAEAERSPAGRLIILTTNTVSMLDSALQVLRRPGMGTHHQRQ